VRLTGRSCTKLGCFGYADVPGLPTAYPAPPGCFDRVIFNSVDVLSAGLLRGLLRNGLAGDYTRSRRFGYEGVTAFKARSDYTHNVTLPNRMTFSTGRPVLQPTGELNTVHHFPMNH